MKKNNPYCRICNEKCKSGRLCFNDKIYHNKQTAKQKIRKNAGAGSGTGTESNKIISVININFDFHLNILNLCNENSNYFLLQ
ncbi:MAG: hypothetical protein LBE18_12155 [Planctomycetaceae bacterium]|jgi:hypothetical protein|nr:hypothetical protein [Planctomycetaceae bacterium]